jgi:hypothetical protein
MRPQRHGVAKRRARSGRGAGGLAADVNAIETGRYDPSLPLAFRLARLFGVSIEDIFQDLAEA